MAQQHVSKETSMNRDRFTKVSPNYYYPMTNSLPTWYSFHKQGPYSYLCLQFWYWWGVAEDTLLCFNYRCLGERPGSLLKVIIIKLVPHSGYSGLAHPTPGDSVFVLELHRPGQVSPILRNMMLFLGHLEKNQHVYYKVIKWVLCYQIRSAICWQEWEAWKMSFFHFVLMSSLSSCFLSLLFPKVP